MNDNFHPSMQVSHAEHSEPHGPTQWLPDGKKCGKQLPQPIISGGSKVKLLFHSNEAVQGSGFQVRLQRTIWQVHIFIILSIDNTKQDGCVQTE